ncbi:unnamed protein product [Arctia plantaginis]|uniref:Uncharacterized protein n=1 Tax=Arctia plantaginis TaxID=874455 RepID=A0A8S0ZUK0_ARCPL|nr:unnamed protein product [Arctia plantaginis]
MGKNNNGLIFDNEKNPFSQFKGTAEFTVNPLGTNSLNILENIFRKLTSCVVKFYSDFVLTRYHTHGNLKNE